MTILQLETRTGHYVCASSCQGRSEHHGYCRMEGSHTACTNNAEQSYI